MIWGNSEKSRGDTGRSEIINLRDIQGDSGRSVMGYPGEIRGRYRNTEGESIE
jgi:hypothetical protein